MSKHLMIAAFMATTLSSVATAEILQEQNIPLDLSVTLAREAVQACAKDNYNVAAAVVDRSGVLRVLMRADKAGPHTVDSARRKAYTSASLRAPTSALAKNVQENPAAAQLAAIDGFLILGGGVPVKVGEETIGAIGVGGAPGGHLDEACAMAAIRKIEDQLQ